MRTLALLTDPRGSPSDTVPRRGLSHGGRGFTLIELMIAVAIVGILAAIAVPSYQAYIEEARRSDGKEKLQGTAQRLERCYTQYGAYNDDDCSVADQLDGGGTIDSNDEDYEISATTLDATEFTLEAEPQDEQSDDDCGTLTMSHTGAKGSDGNAADDCWE